VRSVASGVPVFDQDGRVVGIASMRTTVSNTANVARIAACLPLWVRRLAEDGETGRFEHCLEEPGDESCWDGGQLPGIHPISSPAPSSPPISHRVEGGDGSPAGRSWSWSRVRAARAD
jgi:hypothetical protein